jgi:hypothetical protein
LHRVVDRHRLFVALADGGGESARWIRPQDLRWAHRMDVAIATAVLALRCGLSQSQVSAKYSEFTGMLPKQGEPESLSEAASMYYAKRDLLVERPWEARDVCDFILAAAHRKYALEYHGDRWLASRFKAVPVGVPRTRNRTPEARNYTPHGLPKYRSYAGRLRNGRLGMRLIVLRRARQGWSEQMMSDEPVDLTETSERDWLHTRISELDRIWAFIDVLVQETLGAGNAPEAEETRATVLGMVAQVHWWFSQAMPYRRGSAAVGDMLTKALLQFHGITTPSWREGVAPDLEAFCSGLEEYVAGYEALFVSPPRVVNEPPI